MAGRGGSRAAILAGRHSRYCLAFAHDGCCIEGREGYSRAVV